jgi:hypothetical protein
VTVSVDVALDVVFGVVRKSVADSTAVALDVLVGVIGEHVADSAAVALYVLFFRRDVLVGGHDDPFLVWLVSS